LHYKIDKIFWYFKSKFRFQSPQEVEEIPAEPSTEKMMEDKKPATDTMEEVSLTEFLKSVFAILPISDFISHNLSSHDKHQPREINLCLLVMLLFVCCLHCFKSQFRDNSTNSPSKFHHIQHLVGLD